MPVVYTIRNQRRWFKAWALRVAEAPAPGIPRNLAGFIPMLEPRQEWRVEVSASFPARGRIGFESIRITSGFPLGLFTCFVDLAAPAEVVIYPTLGRMRRNLWRQQTAQSAGTRKSGRGPGQDEFHGIREYRQGDNPRWIHWRRSAHTGELVVREHVPLRDTQLLIVLDPWPRHDPIAASGRKLLGSMGKPEINPEARARSERMISAAATAACDALDRGHRVGLICRAAVPIVVAPAGGRAQRQRLLHELALLSAGSGESLDALISGIRWSTGWNARCLVFATEAEIEHQRACRLLSHRSESTMLISPQSGWLDRLFDITAIHQPEQRRGR